MNKRVAAAVIIAFIVLLTGAAAVILTCTAADRVIEETEKLRSSPADADALEQFEYRWNKREKLLSFYTRHSEIENVTSSVEMLESLADDDFLFEMECQKIIIAAKHLKETEIPYFRNIF